MGGALVHFVEHVHELHGLRLHLAPDLIELGDEVVVSEEGDDPYDEPPDGSDESFVDAIGEQGDVHPNQR